MVGVTGAARGWWGWCNMCGDQNDFFTFGLYILNRPLTDFEVKQHSIACFLWRRIENQKQK